MNSLFILRFLKKLRLHLADSHGQALIEFALVLPILIVVFIGVLEIGRIREIQILLNMAVHQGARVAVLGGDGKETMDSFLAGHSIIDKDRLTTKIEYKYLHIVAIAKYDLNIAQIIKRGTDLYQLKAECKMQEYNYILDLLKFHRLF